MLLENLCLKVRLPPTISAELRPAFDSEIATEVDMCILPFRASVEDLDTVANNLQRIAPENKLLVADEPEAEITTRVEGNISTAPVIIE